MKIRLYYFNYSHLSKSSPSGTARCLTSNGRYIFWSHWKEAYMWDQKYNSCPCHEHLNEEHFQLTASSRMRNGLAEDVLSSNESNYVFISFVNFVLTSVHYFSINMSVTFITFISNTYAHAV